MHLSKLRIFKKPEQKPFIPETGRRGRERKRCDPLHRPTTIREKRSGRTSPSSSLPVVLLGPVRPRERLLALLRTRDVAGEVAPHVLPLGLQVARPLRPPLAPSPVVALLRLLAAELALPRGLLHVLVPYQVVVAEVGGVVLEAGALWRRGHGHGRVGALLDGRRRRARGALLGLGAALLRG